MRARSAARAWLIGGVLLLAASGGGLFAAQGLSDLGARALIGAIELGLPPGSAVSFGAVDADPLGGTARFSNLAVRLGPEDGSAGSLRAAALELAGTPEALAAGRVALLRGRDVTLLDHAGGSLRLGSVEVADVAPGPLLALLAGDPPTGAGAAGRLAADRLELAAGGGRVTAARGAWQAFADGRVAGVELRDVAGEGGPGRLAITRLGFQALDWSRVDRAALAEAVSRAETERRDPDAALAAAEVFLAVAEGELDGLALEGLSFTPAGARPGDGLRADRIAVGELSRGRVGPVEAGRVEVVDAEARVVAAGLAYDLVLEGFPLEESRAALPALASTEEGARRLREILAAVEGRSQLTLESLALTRPGDGGAFSLEQLAVTSDAEDGRAGTAFSVGAFAADAAEVLPDPRWRDRLGSAGLARVTGRAEGSWLADEATRRATLHELGLTLDGLGALRLTGELGTAGREGGTALGGVPGEIAALSLVRASLVYEDRSLVPRVLAALGGADGPPPDAVADAFAAVVEDPAAAPWLDTAGRAALADFLRRPGRLEVELAPAAPVAAPRLLELATRQPQALAPALRLEVRATPLGRR